MAAVYWRLYITANNGGGNTNAAEIELRGTVGGADQCTGGTVTQSSFFAAPYMGSAAFDNNNATMWVATSLPAWVQYQFASAVDVAEYTIRVRNDGFEVEAPQTWELQSSPDGSTWSTQDARSAQTGWSSSEQRTYSVSGVAVSDARLSQVVLEVLRTGTAVEGQLSQVVLEVLRVAGSETPLPPPTAHQPVLCIVS